MKVFQIYYFNFFRFPHFFHHFTCSSFAILANSSILRVSALLLLSICTFSKALPTSSLEAPIAPVREFSKVFLRWPKPDFTHLKKAFSSFKKTGLSFLISSLRTEESTLGLGINTSFGTFAICVIVQ